jgi:hypothetical protein
MPAPEIGPEIGPTIGLEVGAAAGPEVGPGVSPEVGPTVESGPGIDPKIEKEPSGEEDTEKIDLDKMEEGLKEEESRERGCPNCGRKIPQWADSCPHCEETRQLEEARSEAEEAFEGGGKD